MTRRRHKGERPIDKSQFYVPYNDDHPVARAIKTGSRWFDAWQFQNSLSIARLAKLCGIPADRLMELSIGAPVTSLEIGALARTYGVQPADLIASLPDPNLLIRKDGSDGRIFCTGTG